MSVKDDSGGGGIAGRTVKEKRGGKETRVLQRPNSNIVQHGGRQWLGCG